MGNKKCFKCRIICASLVIIYNVFILHYVQFACLENPMDGGAWWAAVHGVAKSQTRLSDFTFTFHFHALEKEMATHSSVLAWRIPGTVEPGRLPSMGLHRVGHDWRDLAAAAADPWGFQVKEGCYRAHGPQLILQPLPTHHPYYDHDIVSRLTLWTKCKALFF